jgi:hypothetical protein
LHVRPLNGLLRVVSSPHMNGYSRKPETSCTSSSSEIEIAPREFRRRTASFVSSRCRTRANNTPVHATQASFLSIDSRRFCEPNDERVSDEKHRRTKPKVCVANRNAKQFWVFTERSASAAATFVTSAGSGNDSELARLQRKCQPCVSRGVDKQSRHPGTRLFWYEHGNRVGGAWGLGKPRTL